MKLLIAALGVLVILEILWDAFETIILPRRVIRRIRLTSAFYKVIWKPWSTLVSRLKGKRREFYLALFGPISLILLLMFWATGIIVGFASVAWGTGQKLTRPASFGTYVYYSGTTFFTLGYGDLTPLGRWGRAMSIIESGTGFGLLAMVIGYLPVLYQAFSRREVNISLLDQRAGSPSSAVELLRRHRASGYGGDLSEFLGDWERWAAELMESHLSYPVLCFFRSQHDNQSWLAAMTTILDTCALVMVGVGGGSKWQARLTFAMARHAIVDIAQVFKRRPVSMERCAARLPNEEFKRLSEILGPSDGDTYVGDEEQELIELRRLYEPYVYALSEMLVMPLPPWILPKDAIDNWKTSAWGRIQ